METFERLVFFILPLVVSIGGIFVVITTVLSHRPGLPFPWFKTLVGVFAALTFIWFPMIIDLTKNVMNLLVGDGSGSTPSPSPTPTPTTAPPSGESTGGESFDPTSLLTFLAILVGGGIFIAIAYFVSMRVSGDLRKRAFSRERRKGMQERWNRIVQDHETVKAKLLKAEIDWDTMFQFPALIDPTVPQTAAMLRALHAADTADSNLPVVIAPGDLLASFEYPKLVRTLMVAWRAAEQNAKRLGQSLLPTEERKKIVQIRDLLAVAEDTASGVVERQLAYRRIQRLVKDLRHVVVPAAALAELEQRQQAAIEAGRA